MQPTNPPQVGLPNQQNHPGILSRPQGISGHGPPPQGLANQLVQPQRLQNVPPQGPPIQMPPHHVPPNQSGFQAQCPPNQVSTSAHGSPGQMGLPPSVQQQMMGTMSHGNTLQQHPSNTSISSQGSGPIHLPPPGPSNGSSQLPQQILGLQRPLQGTVSNNLLQFQSQIQPQPMENAQQEKQESKPDTAELISFD